MTGTDPAARAHEPVEAHQPVSVRIERSGVVLATDVRTARSLWARFMGLMGRAGLRAGEGLWLPTDASIHMLFMRFPIDAVFLAPHASGTAADEGARARSGDPHLAGGGAWRVVAIRERLRPWTGVVWFVRSARGCLELEAGAAAKAGLRVGDVVRFEALTRPDADPAFQAIAGSTGRTAVEPAEGAEQREGGRGGVSRGRAPREVNTRDAPRDPRPLPLRPGGRGAHHHGPDVGRSIGSDDRRRRATISADQGSAARIRGMAMLLDLILPPRCPGCGQEGAAICRRCLRPLERRLDEPPGAPIGLPAELPDGLVQLEWCAAFTGPVRAALFALKYDGEQRVAEPLGRAAGRRWRRAGWGGDLLVPVPIHAERLRSRGYDQALLLAAAAAKELQLPMVPALQRASATTAQYRLGRAGRAANVGHAFECRTEQLARVRGRHVVLVDDIVTTGSTLSACAHALYAAGARTVAGLTVARER